MTSELRMSLVNNAEPSICVALAISVDSLVFSSTTCQPSTSSLGSSIASSEPTINAPALVVSASSAASASASTTSGSLSSKLDAITSSRTAVGLVWASASVSISEMAAATISKVAPIASATSPLPTASKANESSVADPGVLVCSEFAGFRSGVDMLVSRSTAAGFISISSAPAISSESTDMVSSTIESRRRCSSTSTKEELARLSSSSAITASSTTSASGALVVITESFTISVAPHTVRTISSVGAEGVTIGSVSSAGAEGVIIGSVGSKIS
mmetsp:Transcript_5491/g.12935  ORF Transcript_5491/g.12935 Transcript_5491/m.12935 type:complete len:272 (-) Transcript_5491:1152-1967(-)